MPRLSQGLSPLTQCSLSTVYKHSDTGSSVYKTKRQRPIGSETARLLKGTIVSNLRGRMAGFVFSEHLGNDSNVFQSFPTQYFGQIVSTL